MVWIRQPECVIPFETSVFLGLDGRYWFPEITSAGRLVRWVFRKIYRLSRRVYPSDIMEGVGIWDRNWATRSMENALRAEAYSSPWRARI